MPDDARDLERRKLERVLEEIAIREAHEEERTKTAHAKLTSALAVLPIIITLATSGFFAMLPIAAKLGGIGKILALAFLVPIACFCVAALIAIHGLDPLKGEYSVVGIGVIRKFVTWGTYPDLLRKMIAEHGDAVKADGVINGWKLDIYRSATRAMITGLLSLVGVAVLFLLAFWSTPTAFVTPTGSTSSPQSTMSATTPAAAISGHSAAGHNSLTSPSRNEKSPTSHHSNSGSGTNSGHRKPNTSLKAPDAKHYC